MDRDAGRLRPLVMLAIVGALMVSTTVYASIGRHDQTDDAASPGAALRPAIAASLQGVQIDVWGGGAPSPGRTTTMFVHRGDRALELYWTTDGWCVARSFTWTVERARTMNSFDVRYTVVNGDFDCLMDEGGTVRYRVTDTETVDDQSTMTGRYVGQNDEWSERTQCSDDWAEPSPCGFSAVGALVASAWGA